VSIKASQVQLGELDDDAVLAAALAFIHVTTA
jgi:hypothetical protein